MTTAKLNPSTKCFIFSPSVGYNSPASIRTEGSPASTRTEDSPASTRAGASLTSTRAEDSPASTRAGVSPASKNEEQRHFTKNSGGSKNVEEPTQRGDGLIRSLLSKGRYGRIIVIVSVIEWLSKKCVRQIRNPHNFLVTLPKSGNTRHFYVDDQILMLLKWVRCDI
jgi:hypothetical protein